MKNGHQVIALVRAGSESKVPHGAQTVVGNPFEAGSFVNSIPPGAIFVQLLGVSHPSPKKKDQFYAIDLKSVSASAAAAEQAGVAHFVYVSVAQTLTRIMEDYQKVRAMGEEAINQSGIPCTFLRPWYVLGPGHWWPVALLPFYWSADIFPEKWRTMLKALGLVTLPQMVGALAAAVEGPPPNASKVIEIKDMKK